MLLIKKSISDAGSRVKISMIGDILMHQLATEGSFLSNTTYNFDYMFEKFNVDLHKLDVNIVNLEINLCAKKFGIQFFPRFSNRFEIADALVKHGYNVILKATNHVYDHDIEVTGAYLTEQDSKKITYIKKKDIKIAIINYTIVSNRKIPSQYYNLVNIYDNNRLENDIRKAKKEGAEYIILCMHWGKEYSNKPNNKQKELVKIFYKLGIDVVIGTHPHVIQPVEWYKEEGNDRRMLIYYSLGNFINATNNKGKGYYRVFCDGMAYIEIERNKITGKIETKIGKFIPLITHIDKDKDFVQTYLVRDYTPELAKENRIRIRTDNTFNYTIMLDYFNKIISKEFLFINFTNAYNQKEHDYKLRNCSCKDEFDNFLFSQCCNKNEYCDTAKYCFNSQGYQKKL